MDEWMDGWKRQGVQVNRRKKDERLTVRREEKKDMIDE